MDNNKQSLQSEDLNQGLGGGANNTLTSDPSLAPQTPQNLQTPPAAGAPQPNLMVSPEQHPISDNTETKSSSKLAIFLVAGIVLAVLAAGGIYLYLNNQNQNIQTETENVTPVTTPASQPVTEQDVESVDVVDVETEFTDVNKDLQGL